MSVRLPHVALVALAAACPQPQPGMHSTFVRAVDTDSDRAVSVVEDVRFVAHEPRPMSVEVVARAMLSSGLFNQDDAAELAEPIAEELGAMGANEYVRVTAWSDDMARHHYFYIAGGKLRMAYYRGSVELDTYAAPIPADSVAVVAPPPLDRPPPATPDAAPPDPGQPPVVVVVTPPPRKKRAGKCPAVTATTRLSEDDARKKLGELEAVLGKGLISKDEYRCKRKEVLARL